MSDDIRPAVFYLVVHCDPLIYVTPYKKIVSAHALYEQVQKGRPAGPTYRAAQVVAKLSGALLDCGAIPTQETPTRPKSYGGRTASFFVAQLGDYWAAAISDLEKIGVRIYVMPVAGALEGMLDPVADSFNRYYETRLRRLLEHAHKGFDVRPLLEVTLSLAALFEPSGVSLTRQHLTLVSQIVDAANAADAKPRTEAPEVPEPEPEPVSEPASEPEALPPVFDIPDDF